jgi:uncharacterized protein (UPF0332 family)
MLTASEERLQRVTKLPNKLVVLLKEGVSLEAQLSRTLDDAMAQTVADRLDLADEFLTMAGTLLRSRSDLSRPAIARFYYSMYHAMRAVAFQYHKGDDFEEHSTLSSKGVPKDFPQSALASNALKNARILRNEADYEQYPLAKNYFRSEARGLQPVATAFVTDARNYVSSKGNPYA